jgi:hypothetical protein
MQFFKYKIELMKIIYTIMLICVAAAVSYSMQPDGQERGRRVADSMKYFPTQIIAQAPDANLSDSVYLFAIAKDTWKFFENSTYASTGFIPDKIFIKKRNGAHFTSITNIGLYMLCVYQAQRLGLISKEAAIAKIRATLDNLKKLETYNGFYYNWYEFDIMKPSDKYISTVDSGWLYACLWLIGEIYPAEFGGECNALIKAADFKWLYNEKMKAFALGYRVGEGMSPYHYKMLCSEARISFYYAASQNQLEPYKWYYLSRTLDSTYEQHEKPIGNWKYYDTIKYFNGYYTYQNKTKIVPAWGGSLFEVLMPGLLVDERISTKGMGLNNKNIIESHIDYAMNQLKYPIWGLSPCSTPDGGYSEFGVSDLGSAKESYKNGVVTPHASILALNYKPHEVVLNIKNMTRLFPVYGEYGLYDCIKMDSGEVGDVYLALDQSMVFLSIANYLNGNNIQKLFMSKKELKPVLEILKNDEFYN